ncbi:unnamed protein product [Nezara viridula]|uniref:Carboxylic ester hydrolase n=1 Tax=Nezara viridula TaxID=85310 RepID=A0A9P0HTK7_NEZVI|nr:unnamed protein product [Nezara viridula]
MLISKGASTVPIYDSGFNSRYKCTVFSAQYSRTMLTVVLCVAALGHLVLGENPQVTTSYGTMKGQVLKSRDGRDFFSFTKIPYAKPPVGERRFLISEKADNWTGILDATQTIPACYQSFMEFVKIGQEDCLYLNVFSPNLAGKLPVIFSIHGGAFLGGTAGTFGSARFFMDEDVVFVGLNYRLGNLEDNVIPGNNGLKDQALALEWVQKEISAFGGDPNRITVIGESAGGASTDLICSAPRTNGIIKACISQSGVGLSPWVFGKPGIPRQMALNMAKAVGCSENGDLLKCLQSKPIERVANTSLMVDNDHNVNLPTPVLEPVGAPGALLTKWPTGTNHNYPWIIGVVQDEGLIMTAGVPHAAELPYFFEAVSTKPDWPNAADIALSKQLVKMWVNFARDQTPSSQGTVQWPQFKGQYYLDIQDSGVTISNWTDYQETLDFWKSIVPDEPSKSSTSHSSLLLIAAMCIFSVYKTII